MKVGVIGLGAMGTAIARRIEAANYDLTFFNRTKHRADEFAGRGHSIGETPAQAADGRDVVITMLADGPAVEAALLGPDGVLSTEQIVPPAVVVEMSTIGVDTSTRVAAAAASRGSAYLRAPVSGNPGVVAAGELTILTSGGPDALERARPVLEAVGKTIFHLGGGEQARVMKLALNLVLAGTMELLAEAVTVGEAHGLARRDILDVMSGSVIGSPLVKYKAGPLVVDDYSTTASARLLEKDLGLVLDCASEVGVPVPAAAQVKQLLAACVEAGAGELDFSVLVPRLQIEAGLRTTWP